MYDGAQNQTGYFVNDGCKNTYLFLRPIVTYKGIITILPFMYIFGKTLLNNTHTNQTLTTLTVVFQSEVNVICIEYMLSNVRYGIQHESMIFLLWNTPNKTFDSSIDMTKFIQTQPLHYA